MAQGLQLGPLELRPRPGSAFGSLDQPPCLPPAQLAFALACLSPASGRPKLPGRGHIRPSRLNRPEAPGPRRAQGSKITSESASLRATPPFWAPQGPEAAQTGGLELGATATCSVGTQPMARSQPRGAAGPLGSKREARGVAEEGARPYDSRLKSLQVRAAQGESSPRKEAGPGK